jgi:N-acetylneuraminic acid mutarotase
MTKSFAMATWQSLKPMPTKRVYASPVVGADGQLYVIGGCDATGTPIDCFESYHLSKMRWFRLANVPTKRASPCVVEVKGKLLALGGVSVTQQPLNVVEVYDPVEKEWSSKDVMKDHLMGLSAVVRDGKVIVVGGMSVDTNPKDYTMQYDIEKDVWKSIPSMPTARYATFSFLIHDRLYVLGGRQGKLPVSSFEVYDFETAKWRCLPDIPTKRVFALYTHSDSHIFSVGGLNQDARQGFTDVTEIFDIDKETWITGAPMLTKRGDFAVAFQSGRLIVAGGLGNEGKPLCQAEAYDPVANQWTALPNMAVPLCSCSYATISG